MPWRKRFLTLLFEVAEIEVWPFWKLPGDRAEVAEVLDRAEYTVHLDAIRDSTFSVVLNEKEIKAAASIDMPRSVRVPVLPAEVRRAREHPDIRIARRAQKIADLARGISERSVEIGIRRTLLAQARRLEGLARARVDELEKKR